MPLWGGVAVEKVLDGHEKVTLLAGNPKRKIGNNFVESKEIDKIS